jgi:hypothetical protein
MKIKIAELNALLVNILSSKFYTKEAAEKKQNELRDWVDAAKHYRDAMAVKGSRADVDPKLAALLPYAKGERPVIFAADTKENIKQALAFAEEVGLRPIISGDGRLVVFSSEASNLVPGDTNGFFDVFVRDRQAGTTRAGAFDGRLHASRQPDVVVLDQDRVEQPDAMIRRAAGADGVLLQHAQRGRRLARVEDGDPAAGRVGEAARARRDAGQPLEKIQRRPLADQQRAGGAGDLGDLLPCGTEVAVMLARNASDSRLHLAEGFEGDVEAGKHAVGLHQKHAARHLRKIDGRVGRDVPVAHVFFECATHDVPV